MGAVDRVLTSQRGRLTAVRVQAASRGFGTTKVASKPQQKTERNAAAVAFDQGSLSPFVGPVALTAIEGELGETQGLWRVAAMLQGAWPS